MTLDEAIKHCQSIAEKQEKEYEQNPEQYGYIEKFYNLKESAELHRQFAEWLKELKEFKKYQAECNSYHSH